MTTPAFRAATEQTLKAYEQIAEFQLSQARLVTDQANAWMSMSLRAMKLSQDALVASARSTVDAFSPTDA